MNKNELENELKETNKLIEIERKNLIYMLKKINIENINLINFNYKLNDLLNKRNQLENELFNNKFYETENE